MNCLDSSFIVDYLNHDVAHHEDARRWMERHRDEPMLVPYIAAYEVLRGAARSGGENMEQTKSFLSGGAVEVETSGIEGAIHTAEVDADLATDGSPLSVRDTLIASCAISSGYRLVTRDRDFEDTPVDVELYA